MFLCVNKLRVVSLCEEELKFAKTRLPTSVLLLLSSQCVVITKLLPHNVLPLLRDTRYIILGINWKHKKQISRKVITSTLTLTWLQYSWKTRNISVNHRLSLAWSFESNRGTITWHESTNQTLWQFLRTPLNKSLFQYIYYKCFKQQKNVYRYITLCMYT